MPADFSVLFDTLLVIAGLVLVVTGLVMFIRSKTSTGASSVEAFGIKLNVTHPSLILVLAGVGLMLAPRLLPGLPDQPSRPEPAAVAEADKARPAAPAVPADTTPATAPVPAVTPPAATPPARPAADKPAAPRAVARTLPAKPPSVTSVLPAKSPSAPAAPKKPAAQIASVTPDSPAPTPAPPTPAAPVASGPPPAAAKPARPTLAYAALGLPINRSFWSGETRASYTQKMNAVLQHSGRDVLRTDTRALELGQSAFDAWWNEPGQHPRSRELCETSPPPRALLGARLDTPTTFSSVESAYWPELRLRLFVCANQRVYRQQKTLAPHNEDAWPFSVELNSEIERFLRTYRGDLTD